MVNAAAEAIHAVHADNLVVAGNTAPFRDVNPAVLPLDNDWGPLKFMRRMLCIDNAGRPTCNSKVAFDVWAHHPYTSGGPLHRAASVRCRSEIFRNCMRLSGPRFAPDTFSRHDLFASG